MSKRNRMNLLPIAKRRRTLIEITQSNIDNGVPFHPGRCPVALAVCPHVKPDVQVDVGKNEVWFGYFKESEVVRVSADVIEFIQAFDNHQHPTPFLFELDIPEKYLKEDLEGRGDGDDRREN